MVLFTAFYFGWKRQPEIDDLSASSFSSKRSGYMMFNEFGSKIGADIKYLGRDFSNPDADLSAASQIWVIAPEELFSLGGIMEGPAIITLEDEDKLLDWAFQGGCLVICPDYAFPDILDGLIERIGFKLDEVTLTTATDPALRLSLLPATQDEILTNITSVSSYFDAREKTGKTLRISDPNDEASILLKDEHGPAMLTMPYGEGRVILYSDQYIFSNLLLSSDDNAQLAANILALAGDGVIYYDEMHHGRETRRGITDVLRTKAGRGIVVLLIVAGLAIYSAGRRFGPVLPPPPPGRRSPAEYVQSMGQLFRRAQANDLALDVMERDFSSFLKQRFRLRSLEIKDAQSQLKLMGSKDQHEIISLLEEFDKLKKGKKPSARKLIHLSQRIDSLKGVYG